MNTHEKENRAFFIAHSALLCVVLVGFARSFFLRNVFLSTPLSLLLQVHGAVLTLWFALTVLQARLIQTGRRNWHARLAGVAAALVLGVVLSGAWVNTALALDIASAQDPENMFIWANYMSLLSFIVLVSTAIAKRRQPAVHRRLMLFASIAIIGPAFARLAFWPWLGGGLVLAPVFAVAGMLLLVMLAVGYDLLTLRRVQASTLAGFAGILFPLIAGTAVALSGLGFALLHHGAR